MKSEKLHNCDFIQTWSILKKLVTYVSNWLLVVCLSDVRNLPVTPTFHFLTYFLNWLFMLFFLYFLFWWNVLFCCFQNIYFLMFIKRIWIAKYDTRAYEYTIEKCNYSCVNFCNTLLFCPMKSKETAICKLKWINNLFSYYYCFK